MGPRFSCSVSEHYFSVYGQGHSYLRDVCINSPPADYSTTGYMAVLKFA